jgi:site-specific DNA-methyltransferase (adenine-specific)
VIEVHQGDNLDVLAGFADASFDLIYIDPPFNTGKVQRRERLGTERAADGDRTGFQGARYRTVRLGSTSYPDQFADYLAFLEPRLLEARRLLSPRGSFFLHLDYREVHYAKVLLDGIFGRASFMNEIIWAYDYGARSTTRWSAKHDNILWYVTDPADYVFRLEEADRIPYMAPGLVTAAKAERGKTPTDTWWHTIVSPTGREKTGYPTQKPLGILERIVKVHSEPSGRLLDFFAGSGSFGDAADRHGRDVVLVDHNPEAITVMRRRFAGRSAVFRCAGPAPDPDAPTALIPTA